MNPKVQREVGWVNFQPARWVSFQPALTTTLATSRCSRSLYFPSSSSRRIPSGAVVGVDVRFRPVGRAPFEIGSGVAGTDVIGEQIDDARIKRGGDPAENVERGVSVAVFDCGDDGARDVRSAGEFGLSELSLRASE